MHGTRKRVPRARWDRGNHPSKTVYTLIMNFWRSDNNKDRTFSSHEERNAETPNGLLMPRVKMWTYSATCKYFSIFFHYFVYEILSEIYIIDYKTTHWDCTRIGKNYWKGYFPLTPHSSHTSPLERSLIPFFVIGILERLSIERTIDVILALD